ncbi:hypothetical protein C1I98_16495 [Spongiactinospora gelatinilytica]|uniref:non-specific serine/threonine protein kinase n=1 Tax=Spongiactinospora gelatinilytica TaxID=2666298 RepID=A0A2W2I2E5_9ACTN|nr:protein kinase [Spongiactinospora gelatinilytica]PZG44824.1 hypothetical protein C1I98_16495 [Spongiactinospora gelatinilytica]
MADPGSALLGGRYRLLGRLDQAGGPWRARDEMLHRDVAISEVPLPPPGPGREAVLATVRAAAGLRHPAIVTIHDVLVAADRLWMVCELIPGRTLSQTLRAEGPQSAERVADIGLRVFDALRAAKARGVSHGGLSPDAVVIAPDGRVAVSGFATTGSYGDDMRDLGVMLYTALEGHPPGGQGTPMTMGDIPLTDPENAPPPDGPLAPLLAALLQDDPASRPDDESVRLTLLRIAPRHRLARRRGLLLVAGALAVLLAASVAGVLLWRSGTTEPVAAPTPSPPLILPTHFSAPLDPCGFLTNDQMREVGVALNPKRADHECDWLSADSTQPRSFRRDLTIYALHFTAKGGDTGVERARLYFVNRLQQEIGRKTATFGQPIRHTVPPKIYDGPGEQAYITEYTGVGVSYTTEILFRVGNVLIAVQYSRGNGSDPDRVTSTGAKKIAGWIERSLAEG